MAVLLALLCACEVGYVQLVHLAMAGFPDGHLTELDRAESLLFHGFSVATAALSCYFLYCAARNKSLRGALVVFLAIPVLTVGVDVYLRFHLDNGIGG